MSAEEESFVYVDKSLVNTDQVQPAPVDSTSAKISEMSSLLSSCEFSLFKRFSSEPSGATSLPAKLNNSVAASGVQRHSSAPELEENLSGLKEEDEDEDGDEKEEEDGTRADGETERIEEFSHSNGSHIPLSLDFGDFETALICLREENDKLRYALEMNTEAMKRQLNVIKVSREESLKMKKTLEDLREMKDSEIEELKRENQELRSLGEKRESSYPLAADGISYPTLPALSEYDYQANCTEEQIDGSYGAQSGITELLEEHVNKTKDEIYALRLQLDLCMNDLKAEKDSKVALVELSQKLEKELAEANKILCERSAESSQNEMSSNEKDEKLTYDGHTPLERRHGRRRHGRHRIKLTGFRKFGANRDD